MSASMGAHKRVKVSDLHTYGKNPRRGDVDAIAASLRVNNQYRPIVVNKGTHTGRKMEVLAGNHTLMAARQLAEEDARFAEIDTWLIDVDEDHATRIVLADNRTSELGGFDNHELLDLLESLPDGREGTGYDDVDVEHLLAAITEPSAFDEYYENHKHELEAEDGEVEDDDDVPEPEFEKPTLDRTADGVIVLTFDVSAKNRRHIRRVLSQLAKNLDLDSQSAALVHVVQTHPETAELWDQTTADDPVNGDIASEGRS